MAFLVSLMQAVAKELGLGQYFFMFLRSLYLHQFRNHEDSYIEFDPHVNVLQGANAQGKTSVLEAIHYLMIGRSFRTLQGCELIKQGHPSFYLDAIFSKHGVEQRLRIGYDRKERKVLHNSTPLTTISSLLGLIQGVVMTPDDIQLVKGSPQLRRQFLDIQIAQIDPLYAHHLSRYTRAMKQRNHLLRIKELLTIESWEHEMSQSGAYIMLKRAKTVQRLQECCQKVHSFLSGELDSLKIIYKTGLEGASLSDLQQHQLNQFQKYRSREMLLGYTLTGPHKEDLTFTIEGRDIRDFASEGQQRTCVTALHLAEWHHLKEAGEELPLMMIDDVGMSLDSKRRNNLLSHLSDLGQVFLSTTDEAIFYSLKKAKKLIRIQNGSVFKEDLQI